MCRALGATVLAFDPLVPEDEIVQASATPVSLDDLARAADIVSLHVPEGEATRGMIDATFIGMMRPSAYLVNTSSGAAVEDDALVRALEAGQIAGAALDVFEGQPLPMSSPLLSAPNLLLTPHIAGATQQTVERHSIMMVEAIEALLDGRAIPHLVNPDYQVARAR
jgi:phosphoglycerate dehydrogenase-like enzyme